MIARAKLEAISNYCRATAKYCCIAAHVDQGLMHWKLQRDALPVITSGENSSYYEDDKRDTGAYASIIGSF